MRKRSEETKEEAAAQLNNREKGQRSGTSPGTASSQLRGVSKSGQSHRKDPGGREHQEVQSGYVYPLVEEACCFLRGSGK